MNSRDGEEVPKEKRAKTNIQHYSLLRLGVGARLLLAGLGSAIIWGAIAWALR